MLLKKITAGYVVQTFDSDKGKFIAQEFIAGDETEYEDGAIENAYLPFDMVQPGE